MNSVVGVTGFFNEQGTLRSVGIQCALCHSTVDDPFAPGIGHRLDGWAARDLNVGAIVALAPDLSYFANLLLVDQATVRTVLHNWGSGHFGTLLDVVNHYDESFGLGLSDQQKSDLVEYLKSL